MSVPTEEAERLSDMVEDQCNLSSPAAALRSLAAERDALQAKAFRVAVAYEALKAENARLREALRGVLAYYNAPTPAEAKLKKAVLATPIEQARAALGEKE